MCLMCLLVFPKFLIASWHLNWILLLLFRIYMYYMEEDRERKLWRRSCFFLCLINLLFFPTISFLLNNFFFLLHTHITQLSKLHLCHNFSYDKKLPFFRFIRHISSIMLLHRVSFSLFKFFLSFWSFIERIKKMKEIFSIFYDFLYDEVFFWFQYKVCNYDYTVFFSYIIFFYLHSTAEREIDFLSRVKESWKMDFFICSAICRLCWLFSSHYYFHFFFFVNYFL